MLLSKKSFLQKQNTNNRRRATPSGDSYGPIRSKHNLLRAMKVDVQVTATAEQCTCRLLYQELWLGGRLRQDAPILTNKLHKRREITSQHAHHGTTSSCATSWPASHRDPKAPIVRPCCATHCTVQSCAAVKTIQCSCGSNCLS